MGEKGGLGGAELHPYPLPNLAHSLLQIRDPHPAWNGTTMVPPSTWWQNTTALNREKIFLTPGFQMAAGMLHVAADIQSWLVHLRSNQAQVTLFSSSLCGFLTVCSICWRWKIKSSSVFCLRDQTAETQKENNFKPCFWVKFLHFQTLSAAPVWHFGVLSWPLGTTLTKACALWKYLHIVLCPHQ